MTIPLLLLPTASLNALQQRMLLRIENPAEKKQLYSANNCESLKNPSN